MTQVTNHQFKLAARPVGAVKATDWARTEEAVCAPAEGEVVIQNQYLSLDPAMRGWMNDAKSYIPPVGIGEVMRALGVGQQALRDATGADYAPSDQKKVDRA